MDRRQQRAMGIVFGLMVLFFAGIDRFEGDRRAQAGVAGLYVAAVVALLWRAKRRAA